MNLPKYLRIRRRKDFHVPTFLDSSLYRSVSARIYHGRWSGQTPSFTICPSEPTPDEGVDLGWLVRDTRRMEEQWSALLWRSRDNPSELDLVRRAVVLSHGVFSEALAASLGGNADQSGLPGTGSADRDVREGVVR